MGYIKHKTKAILLNIQCLSDPIHWLSDILNFTIEVNPMLADYIYDGIISLYNLALETLFNIATLNIYYAIN